MEKEILSKLICFLIACLQVRSVNDLLRKKYDSITTFNEIHNIFLFNLVLVYQLIEYRQGFLFNIHFHWEYTTQKAEFCPLEPRQIFLNTEQKVERASQIIPCYKLSLKQVTISHDAVSAVCLKN